jgi:Na+-driven multidrug efflux pump
MQTNLNKQFYNYLWAYILVALSGCLGNVVDGIIVGNLISEDGVSAINLSKPINQFIFTLHLLINAGAGMLVAYALGKNDIQEANRLFTRALTFSVGIGVLLAVGGGIIFPSGIAHLLCSNEQIFPLASDYMQILLLGNPAFILMWGLSTMVGVDGTPKLVSLAVVIDNVANLSLDIIFIQWMGWGIAGSSAATVVGHLIGIAILLSHWRKKREDGRSKTEEVPRRLALDFTLTDNNTSSLFTLRSSLFTIVKQGAPLAIASISLTLLMLSANTIVLGTLGRTGIFAFAVCMNLLQVYNLFLSGTCQTLQSLGAIQLGQGNIDGIRLVIRKAFRFITIAMIVTCMVVWIDPQLIARLFGADEPQFISETEHALRVFALSFIPFCYIYVLMIVYKLYKYHRMALFISFALSLTVIPVLWIMARTAPELLWYSYLIAYLIEAVLIYILHRATHVKFLLLQ